MITIKNERELKYMRDAGGVVAKTFKILNDMVKPGVTTKELDAKAEDFIISQGARPAFKGYGGFPGTLCTSVNDEVVHGIPGLRKLENGDIISIDCGAVINGFVGDSALTLPVGNISHEAQELLRVTEESLYAGIAQAVEGNRLSDVSHAVQKCAEKQGMSVVRDYVGHGIGAKMHEDPQIPNFGPPGRGPRLKRGMTLAIEPMVNLGTFEVRTLDDNWTVVTLDGRLSAHFEHTIAITDDTPEILTKL
ncbi:methionine aminopeptidase, type I [Desulforamulus reducens MI-1]|uniref:Methionine aminopeptidase n=1 Tax=Desulforamulus reducens (strain ATCC BAA-1160 / DSM 100696 / MI-1) TaxID=349161 RepID=A4J132_DESRM|nr:type I methionyl aminopeptidase [Desulforamulus reducens]ABO48785.1 methionine aminopeptidase, type I [Desulforamulus reducens MI-1]